jgi:hypothetical protein
MDRTSLYFTFFVAALSLVVSLNVYGQTTDGEQAPQAAPQADVTPQPAQTSNDNAPKTSTEPGNDNDPLEEYRARELFAKYSFWQGLKIFCGEKPLDLGLFGSNYKEIFAGSPAALDSMSNYRKMRITGSFLWDAGMILLITDLILIATRSSSVIREDAQGNRSNKPLFWVLFASGGVLSFSGVFIGAGATGYLTDAIEQYNADLALKIRDRAAAFTMRRAPGLSVRGSF